MRSTSRFVVLALAAMLTVLIAGLGLAPVASAADNVTFVVKIDGEDVSKLVGIQPRVHRRPGAARGHDQQRLE